MTSSPLSSLLCPACSGENTSDSRFCRHCGHVLEGASAESASAESPSLPVVTPVVASVEADAVIAEDEPLSSPAEIDGRHAKQLLERALHLSERGDTGGAILACRQSIALAPSASSGHSMLGLLLERSGDLPHAIAAYEKAVQLEPENVSEREHLERVREKAQSQQSDTLFRFDEDELFAGTTTAASESEVAAKTAALVAPEGILDGQVAPVDAAAGAQIKSGDSSLNVKQPDLTSSRDGAGALPATPPVKPKSAAPVIFERRLSQRRRFNMPITVERRHGFDRRAIVGAVQPLVPSPMVAPIFQAPVAVPVSPWANLWSRPSYFGRSLPLAGVTVLALGLLSWARSGAIARAVDEQMKSSVVLAPPTDPVVVPPVVSSSPGLPALAPVGAPLPQNGGLPISNRPDAPATPARVATSGGAGSGQRLTAAPRPGSPNRPGAATGRAPRFSPVIPPAAIPPARVTANSGSGDRNSDPLSLPAPNIPSPAPAAPPVAVLPAGSSPALNPAGSSGRGYVRITQGRIGTSALPQRPGSQGNSEERNAASAARNGQNDQAIERLTVAINAGAADAGYRYQQRAILFLDSGDYSRAADDFQAAITAYSAQIERGEQVAAARAGLRSARSGLNAALAGGRH